MEIQNTIDSIKPEQMESGKWYVIKTRFKYLSKYKEIIKEFVYEYKGYSYETIRVNGDFPLCHIDYIKSILPATNEEVLKHFPDEKFENVSLINEVNNTQVTEQQNQIESEKVEVDWKAKFEEEEEVSEELTEKYNKLNAKFEELQKDYENLHLTYQKLIKIHEKQDLAYDALADKYSKLELQQNNQEKVYIHYNSKREKWLQAESLELALQESPENKNIYEAVKIGVKKSILVSE